MSNLPKGYRLEVFLFVHYRLENFYFFILGAWISITITTPKPICKIKHKWKQKRIMKNTSCGGNYSWFVTINSLMWIYTLPAVIVATFKILNICEYVIICWLKSGSLRIATDSQFSCKGEDVKFKLKAIMLLLILPFGEGISIMSNVFHDFSFAFLSSKVVEHLPTFSLSLRISIPSR